MRAGAAVYLPWQKAQTSIDIQPVKLPGSYRMMLRSSMPPGSGYCTCSLDFPAGDRSQHDSAVVVFVPHRRDG